MYHFIQSVINNLKHSIILPGLYMYLFFIQNKMYQIVLNKMCIIKAHAAPNLPLVLFSIR